MDLTFAATLNTLDSDAVIRIANGTRPPAEYVWADILPERGIADYRVEAGSMTVKPIMAGLVGMDSPYPPGGHVSATTFLEQLPKLAQEVPLSEKAIRQLQAMALRGMSREALVQEALNFLSLVVIQPHLDTAEWMRGQVLTTGSLTWTFGDIALSIDYGVPAGNILPTRTTTEAWDSTDSKFWDDIALAQGLLNYQAGLVYVGHPDTINAIVQNPANNLAITNQSGFDMTISRLVGSLERTSSDTRETIRLISHTGEGNVLAPDDPSTVQNVPFCPKGTLTIVAPAGSNRDYQVGMGAQMDAESEYSLGYTHIGPTVEGDGAVGRWADLRVPDERPWQLVGRSASNVLPVIENPKKLVIASSDLA